MLNIWMKTECNLENLLFRNSQKLRKTSCFKLIMMKMLIPRKQHTEREKKKITNINLRDSGRLEILVFVLFYRTIELAKLSHQFDQEE